MVGCMFCSLLMRWLCRFEWISMFKLLISVLSLSMKMCCFLCCFWLKERGVCV